MFGTIIAVIIAILIHFSTIETTANLTIFGIIIAAVATLFLIIPMLVFGLSWSPLQKAEQKLTPKVSNLFMKDWIIRGSLFFLLLFPLISFAMSIDLLLLNSGNPKIFIALWIILLGISLDVLFLLIRRISGYLDPFYIANLFSKEAHRSIQNDHEIELCEWIDALSEISIKAIERNSLSLCNNVDGELQRITSSFLESARSLTHQEPDKETEARGIVDKVSYTLFFSLQRLEMINDKAIERKIEPVCSNLVATVGKIVISAAKYDISMASYPLHFLGRFALNAQKNGITEVGPKAICILFEVAKAILTESDVTYMELQDPYLTLVAQMQEISRVIFKQDKMMNIKILTQPFKDLKGLFATEKMAAHPDTPVILQAIDRVIAEFDALEAVMRTMPPMPNLEA